MAHISVLLSKKNIAIFNALSKQTLSIRDLAEKVKCSPGTVHRAVLLFKKNNLVNTKKHKNTLLVIPERKSPLYIKIKSLINISTILKSKGYPSLSKAGVIGIYGSYAKGTDDPNSDIDMLILSDKKEMKVQEIIRALGKELGKNINPLIITPNKLQTLEMNDPEFYSRIKFGLIELNGEIFG